MEGGIGRIGVVFHEPIASLGTLMVVPPLVGTHLVGRLTDGAGLLEERLATVGTETIEIDSQHDIKIVGNGRGEIAKESIRVVIKRLAIVVDKDEVVRLDIIEKAGCVIGVVHRSTELDRYLPFEVGGRGTLTKYDAERAIQPFVLFHLESGPLAGINKILQGLLHILENLFV
jgi:hypothetical protein